MASDVSFSWRRSFAWALSFALHLALLVAMTLPRGPEPLSPGPEVFLGPTWVPVDVSVPPIEQSADDRADPLRDVATTIDTGRTSSPAPDRRVEAIEPGSRPLPPERRAAEASRSVERAALPPVARGSTFLDDEARALLPQEPLYAAAPAPREGGYYTPGDGREDDVFYRPRALDPNPSRFAHAWQPRGNLIDGWLGALVEKATGKVSIPLNSKFNLVCATVAGVAGSCAIVRNAGTGVIVQRPPPAPWDRSHRVQCRELRQAVEAAEDPVELAYFLDRLSALCSDEGGNDEARREAGLRDGARASDDAMTGAQRAR